MLSVGFNFAIVVIVGGHFKMNIHPIFNLLVITICFPTRGYCGRYKAPNPSEVNFPYRRVPTMKELIEDAGHLYDRHNVTTEDGHILALHRISHRAADQLGGVPVLFVVGYGFQSESWIVLGNSSLPFVLTELGYDVWLGDPRGCVRSLEHTSYSFDDWRNMNYTFHERGVYDVPAFIDKILGMTGHRQLLYVGHSLGAGALIIMNSERPEYGGKILAATMISPAGHFLKWERNPFIYQMSLSSAMRLVEGAKRVKQSVYPGGPKELLLGKQLTASLCSLPGISIFCRITHFMTVGINDSVNWDSYSYQLATAYTTIHMKTTKHVIQNIRLGRFAKYDFGTENNVEIYGQECPPNYKFNNTMAPVYMIYGGKDFIIAPGAAERTARALGNLKKKKLIKNYDHWDFLMAPSAPQKVFEEVVEFFDTFAKDMLDKHKIEFPYNNVYA